ncbi:serine hydrolase domain-containing protein [Gephyromycinifex aptenodytis]|uniref:serine hydrolase domain-containing protein n=1 Tax=Gephyromycinifex aptenodytis TaxID=2716227 RepID=UPI0014452D17|nr:serine hydrolase domain-containing protein [Gephyromycinifex aptenodytis]
MLPRATPSSQDVDAARIGAFIHAAARARIELHSLMVLRRGNVIAQGWWEPYTPDGIQLVYSLSKAFTSAAVGIAQAEGLLDLESTVAEALGEDLPGGAAEWTRTVRVRDLLTMSTGHEDDPINAMSSSARSDRDPLRTFLELPAEHDPGLFTYNQGATLTLSAILARVTGEPLLDWLRPRLLDPLGAAEATWNGMKGTVGPGGQPLAQGFTGLHVRTETIAAFGELLRCDGQWGDRRLIPAGYLAQARRPLVPNAGRTSNPDWQQGYGFQLWSARHGYRGDGAYGQFCIVLPEQQAVIAMTAQCPRMQEQLDLVWEHLLPAFDSPGSPEADDDLEELLLSQRLEPLSDQEDAGVASVADLFGRDHDLRAPALFLGQVERVRIDETPQGWSMTWHTAQGGVEVPVGRGEWTRARLPAPDTLHTPVALSGACIDGELRVRVVYVESPHCLTVSLRPDGAALSWRTLPLA